MRVNRKPGSLGVLKIVDNNPVAIGMGLGDGWSFYVIIRNVIANNIAISIV